MRTDVARTGVRRTSRARRWRRTSRAKRLGGRREHAGGGASGARPSCNLGCPPPPNSDWAVAAPAPRRLSGQRARGDGDRRLLKPSLHRGPCPRGPSHRSRRDVQGKAHDATSDDSSRCDVRSNRSRVDVRSNRSRGIVSASRLRHDVRAHHSCRVGRGQQKRSSVASSPRTARPRIACSKRLSKSIPRAGCDSRSIVTCFNCTCS